MEFSIITIPHESQRYETCGDYMMNDFVQCIDIKVSETGNDDYNFLVGLHEMIESYLCYKRGINFKEVDSFDVDYEKNRSKGDMSEPGDSKKSPYCKEHRFATKIEKLMAKELKVKWNKYNKAIESL
jgi:hypothetical protein